MKKQYIISIIIVIIVLSVGLFLYPKVNNKSSIVAPNVVITPAKLLVATTTKLISLAPKDSLVPMFPNELVFWNKDIKINYSAYSSLKKENETRQLVNTEYTTIESTDNLLTFYLNYVKKNKYITKGGLVGGKDRFVFGEKIIKGKNQLLNISIRDMGDSRKINISIIK
ncbi:MAG: hypothetical protein WAV25_00245 [Minisyncoccia bacterium]